MAWLKITLHGQKGLKIKLLYIELSDL